MCDSSDKSGLLASSPDMFVDFFPPPYTTVVIPPQYSRRHPTGDEVAGENGRTVTTSNDRKLKIRLLLLIALAILSLLAIVAISLQLIVRHLEACQLPISSEQEPQQLLLPEAHQETVIEIQLLGEQESMSENGNENNLEMEDDERLRDSDSISASLFRMLQPSITIE